MVCARTGTTETIDTEAHRAATFAKGTEGAEGRGVQPKAAITEGGCYLPAFALAPFSYPRPSAYAANPRKHWLKCTLRRIIQLRSTIKASKHPCFPCARWFQLRHGTRAAWEAMNTGACGGYDLPFLKLATVEKSILLSPEFAAGFCRPRVFQATGGAVRGRGYPPPPMYHTPLGTQCITLLLPSRVSRCITWGMEEHERRSAKLPPVRLTEEELGRWRAEATLRGVKLSEYVRWAVNGAQTGEGTRVEIPVEAVVEKKETAVEKEKPKRVLPAPRPASDHTKTIAALKKIPGIKTGADVLHDRPRPAPTSVEEGRQNSDEGSVSHVVEHAAVTIRGTPLKEKNSRAMLSLLGIREVLEPEVLPPQPDPPEVPAAESQQVAVRKRPAPPVKPATVGDDSGPTATRDWGDVLPIGNPRAKAAEEEREELRRRRLM